MTGWNMPPGCTEGMIPGNRQIDIEIEKLFDELDGMIVTFLNESDHVDKADIPQVLRDLLTQYEHENQEPVREGKVSVVPGDKYPGLPNLRDIQLPGDATIEAKQVENRCRFCGEIPENCECSRGGKR